jgi:anti-anti-sigma regulatory factor
MLYFALQQKSIHCIMEFKIDTKPSFTVIAPANDTLSAKMADALQQKCTELRQSGSNNFIIDLGNCLQLESGAVEQLLQLHEESYNMGQSLVLTNTNNQLMNAIVDVDEDMILNVAPRMEEAVDIVSMEILERDLFNEEEG